MQISNGSKEPNIKLIPSDPMTNTILIIYCVSSTGASVPYKSIWRRINPKKNKVEEIKNHNGSSYRCSPLDMDYIIEATVIFQHMNMQVSKVVQSNMVKVSRQLKERRMYIKQAIPCRLSIDQLSIQVKVALQDGNFLVIPTSVAYQQTTFSISLGEIVVEAESNQHVFRIYFKTKFQQFIGYFGLLLGWKPQIKSQYFTFFFNIDISRDIILLGIAQSTLRSPEIQSKMQPMIAQNNLMTFNQLTPLPEQKLQSPIATQIKEIGEIQPLGHIKNRSQTSLSPANSNRQKIKPSQKSILKKSFTSNQTNNQNQQKKSSSRINYMSPQTKDPVKEKPKDRQYLNVFQQDDFLEEIVLSNTQNNPTPTQTVKTNVPVNPGDQPSINLRGSFQQLQRSFSNVNDEVIQKVFGNSDKNKKNSQFSQQQFQKLKQQNEELRKQAETITALTKQNHTIKKKYHELKQDINRLEMERKVILTDKLRCEVNWHKEIQEKQFFKKQVEHLRELLRNSSNPIPIGTAPTIPTQPQTLPPNFIGERTLKSNSIHQAINIERRLENRERNRSPNSTLYNR